MKRAGRVKLFCYKKLPCGVIDRFEVIVSEKDESAARAKYATMGYKVVNG